MMTAVLHSAILDLAILHKKKNFTYSFSFNLMIAGILNSAILESAILHIKKLHSFIWLNFMMAAILNSSMLDSDTAILDSNTLLSSLRFTQKHSHSTLSLIQTNSIWLNLIYSHLTWWWQPSWILPSWILPSRFQPSKFFLSNSLTLAKNDSHHFCKKTFTQLFWHNLMMAAILNSAMLDSDTAILDSNTLLSSLRFTQKHSHSTLTLTQTNSISLTWWWQPSCFQTS